ncbi:MAG: hypothetical protein IJC39_02720, partial [Firmicutes bacterium]|nr:hypothetical protein [Bacillota bacterium]
MYRYDEETGKYIEVPDEFKPRGLDFRPESGAKEEKGASSKDNTARFYDEVCRNEEKRSSKKDISLSFSRELEASARRNFLISSADMNVIGLASALRTRFLTGGK